MQSALDETPSGLSFESGAVVLHRTPAAAALLLDGRTTRHGGYAASQRIRKRIQEAFGWITTVAGQEKTRFRGRGRVGWAFTFTAAAYNLVRLPKLIAKVG